MESPYRCLDPAWRLSRSIDWLEIPRSLPLSWSFVVRPLGFEPRTCGLRVRCSAVELEARLAWRSVGGTLVPPNCDSGVTDGARPRDIQDHNLALYQLSYGHHVGRHHATHLRRLHKRSAGPRP